MTDYSHLVGVLRRMADHIEEGRPNVMPLAHALYNDRFVQLRMPNWDDDRLGFAILDDASVEVAVMASRAAGATA